MAFELAQRAPAGLYAGFATNCGTYQVGAQCAPVWSHAQIHIHATDDPTIPYDGTPSSDGGGWRYESVDNALGRMAASAMCASRTTPAERGWVQLSSLDPSSASAAPHNTAAAASALLNASGLPWLAGLTLPTGNNFALATRQDARCRLRASDCANGAQFVECTGEFGHDWPYWAAATSYRFLRQFQSAGTEPSPSVVPPCTPEIVDDAPTEGAPGATAAGAIAAFACVGSVLACGYLLYMHWRRLPMRRARAVKRQLGEVTTVNVEMATRGGGAGRGPPPGVA